MDPNCEGRRALILLGHGARNLEWASPLLAVRDKVRKKYPDCRVELAFLELTPPSLAGIIHELVKAGLADFIVLPMFIAQGGHLQRGLPALVKDLQEAHPKIRIQLLPPIGTSERVLMSMADQAGDYLE